MTTKIRRGTISHPLDESRVLDHGILSLTRVDGDDATPAEAARTSFRSEAEDFSDGANDNLVDYLIRKKHSTPIEFCGAVFYMRMPILVARQLVRHRTASINEESLRYIEARDEMYVPALDRMQGQSKSNKQGSSSTIIDEPSRAWSVIDGSNRASYDAYKELLNLGLARELSRGVLPVNLYTAWYWTANLRNVFQLLALRIDSHAQYEIRVYADAMLEQLRPYFPNIIAAWENHVLYATTFSRDEMAILRSFILELGGYPTATRPVGVLRTMSAEAKLRDTRIEEFITKVGLGT